MEFIAATNNPGKMAEMRRILERMGHTVRSQREAGVTLEPEENSTTFAENARIKARAICEVTGVATIADDSGLCVDALDGAPGLYSARYAGTHGDSDANIDKLLREIDGIDDPARTARFVCVLALVRHADDPMPLVAEGRWEGRVLRARRGGNGFGYDPVFFSPVHGCSAAELPADVKNRDSHRGQALAALPRGTNAWLARGAGRSPLLDAVERYNVGASPSG